MKRTSEVLLPLAFIYQQQEDISQAFAQIAVLVVNLIDISSTSSGEMAIAKAASSRWSGIISPITDIISHITGKESSP